MCVCVCVRVCEIAPVGWDAFKWFSAHSGAHALQCFLNLLAVYVRVFLALFEQQVHGFKVAPAQL